MPIDVPYHSQWADPSWTKAIVEDQLDPCADPSWRTRGFTDQDEYRFWAKRTCGLACLESMLAYWHISIPTRASLLRNAIERGVYVVTEDGGVRGLIYRPFADWLQDEYRLQVAVRGKSSLNELLAEIPPDGFGMASVSPQIRYPNSPCEAPGGHLVLILASAADHVVFHNPSGVAPFQAHAKVPKSVFERFYANRGMVITKPGGLG